MCLLLLLATASPAAADPAGPTEYVTEIQSIEPFQSAVSVRMIGGDSFFELTQLEPVLIEVQGYRGEPYLQILPDGTIQENRLAPTTYLNEERYGAGDLVPASADPDAAPDWVVVGTGGRYAWHDHRSHWMNPQRPPGSQAGDAILEAVVPISVDGTDVKVTVVSFLQDDPSPVPALAGLVVGAAAAAVMLLRSSVVVAVGTAFVVAVVGLVTFGSVPSETGPAITLWILPTIGLVALLAGLVMGRGPVANPLPRIALLTVGGVQLILWAVLQRSALTKAILPTDIPWSLFRFSVVASFVVGIAVIGIAVRMLQEAFSAPVA